MPTSRMVGRINFSETIDQPLNKPKLVYGEVYLCLDEQIDEDGVVRLIVLLNASDALIIEAEEPEKDDRSMAVRSVWTRHYRSIDVASRFAPYPGTVTLTFPASVGG